MKRPASAWPDEWTLAEREEYKRAYLAGEPVLMAMAYHEEGECAFCDTLRELIREANAEDDK
jgi:hypothetical protein